MNEDFERDESTGELDMELPDDFYEVAGQTKLEPEPPKTLPASERRAFVLMQGKERELEKTMDLRLQELIARMPKEFEGLTVRLNVTVRPRAKPGASLVLKDIIKRILSPAAIETQTAIRDFVHARHPEHGIYKDWTRPLPKWALIVANEEIKRSGGTFSALRLKKTTTLAQLHQLARSALAISQGRTETFTAEIALTEDTLSISGKTFSISDNRSGGKVYRTARINVDQLREVLRNKT